MTDYAVFADRERLGWANDEITRNYIESFGPVSDQAAERVLAAIAPGPGREVLDLCCGHGRLTARLLESGATVAGLDFSSTMLEKAARQAPAAALRQGDAQDLPYPDAAFHAVACNLGIPHLPDQPRALSEIRRVLRPDGVLAFSSWVGPEASPAYRIFFNAVKTHADLSVPPPAQPDLYQFARPEIAERLLADAGFRLDSHFTVDCAWQLETPAKLFDIFAAATVGASMLLKGQTPPVVEEIRDAMTRAVVETCAGDGGYRVAVPAAVVVARPA